MNKISRRALAVYAVERLSQGESVAIIAKQLAGVLVESGRTGEIDFLLGDIAWELERRGVLASIKVTSATPLTKELEAQIKARVKKAVATKEVLVEKQLNKAVLGGLRVETATQVWDTTIRRQLTDLRESI